MHIKDLYSVVVTERRAECRDFYIRWFGFRVVFEESWFVYLAASDDHPFGVAFMTPDHPSRPPGGEAFNGKGLLLTLQSLGGSAGSRYMIHRAPGSMSSSRSTRRRGSGESTIE